MAQRHRRRTARTLGVLAAAALALTPAVASADWRQPVGGTSPINFSAARSADDLDLTSIGGVPYIAWNEDTTQGTAGSSSTIRVARLSADGTAWQRVGDAPFAPISSLSSTSSHTPSLDAAGTTPWVAWSEGLSQSDQEIRAARLNAAGTAWERVPDVTRPINHVRTGPGGFASNPTLRVLGGRPYVSFFEADPGTGSLFFQGSSPAQVWVDRLNAAGTGWEEVGGGSVNADPTHDAAFPKMTMINGVPWIAYFQVAVVNGNPTPTIRVSHLSGDGNSWVPIPGEVLPGAGDVNAPEIENVGGVPYVALAVGSGSGNSAVHRISVYRLDDAGDGFVPVGTSPVTPANADSDSPSLEVIAGQPWLSWRQRSNGPTIRTARLVGTEWQPVGSGVAEAASNANITNGPALTSVGGFPWVAFGESDGQSQGGQGQAPCCTQERVARLEPTLGAPSVQSAARSASVLMAVDAFGLPFPVGFEHGRVGGFPSSTAATAADGSGYAFAQLSGLTPATVYNARGYATAGTPLPRVHGPSAAFATAPAEQVGQGNSPPPQGGDQASPYAVFLQGAGGRFHRGRRVHIHYLASRSGLAAMTITRAGRQVRTFSASVSPGRHAFAFRTRALRPGRYRLALTLLDSNGHTARDVSWFRIVR